MTNQKEKKTTQLKKLINQSSLDFLMEAHNGLSAKIVEETGFKGIWASGLSLSASMGVRDNNEASWTQVLDVLEFMSDATTIPILLDGDTGYGNFNNVRRLVKKLEQRYIAGVCIEDKLFPKTNSYIDSTQQPLADINEFCGKIKAAKDTQLDPDFIVIARVEAFIAGWGLDEALNRAHAYKESGADAILMHSKLENSSEIESFMKEWKNRLPVIIVPTKYYKTPVEIFKAINISTVIWANHNLRASIQAMKNISNLIYKNESIQDAENVIVPIQEVFRIQQADEYSEAEARYVPSEKNTANAIILAAAQGNLGTLTEKTPKTLLKINNKSILETQLSIMRSLGMKDITIVRGFGKKQVSPHNTTLIDNDHYETTCNLYSLNQAKDHIKNQTIISFGDIIFKDFVLKELLNHSGDCVIVVDSDSIKGNSTKEFIEASEKNERFKVLQKPLLKQIQRNLDKDKRHGEFIGLMKVNEKGSHLLINLLKKFEKSPYFKTYHIYDILNKMSKELVVEIIYIKESWVDVNTVTDLYEASQINA
jgi:phosphoenolpyruvate phosphomutase